MRSHYYLFPQNSCLIKCMVWMLLHLGTATQCFHFSPVFSMHVFILFVFCKLCKTVTKIVTFLYQSLSCCVACLGIRISEHCSEMEVHSHCRDEANFKSPSNPTWASSGSFSGSLWSHQHSALTLCEQFGHGHAGRTADPEQRLGKKQLSRTSHFD